MALTLLTVETEVNGDSRSTNERGPSLVLRCVRCTGTRDVCPALVAVVGPVRNMYFLTVQHFSSFVPFSRQAGQAVVLGHLSLNVCLWGGREE